MGVKAIIKACGSPLSRRFFLLASASLALVSMTGCYTTYDSYGRPVQSVDPGMAIAGIAAAGLIGYAIADRHDSHRGYGGGHHGGHHGGGRRNYCRY